MTETEELQQKIKTLEEENAFLKSLLDEAGISYDCINLSVQQLTNEPYEPDQGSRILPAEITHTMVRKFFSYFWGRMDVFSKRYQNKNTGKTGYFPQCDNFWRKGICPKVTGSKVKCKDCEHRAWTELQALHIEKHLLGSRADGSDVIGVYPLFPDGTCRFLVFDFDNHTAGAESVNLKSFRSYDRMLPAQNSIEDGEVGNLIALPLQGQALKAGNSAFIDKNWNAIPNQWDALFTTRRLSKEQIETYIKDWSSEKDAENVSAVLLYDGEKPWKREKHFHREDVLGEMHIVLADRIYVRTENLKPRIQNQIRRLAAFSNPKFFKNDAIGLSNYAESRMIYLGEDDSGYICIPRGLLENLTEQCISAGIVTDIVDNRSEGRIISAEFTGELRDNQKKAVNELMKYDCGILSAATAFGKTVTCSEIIAEKKVSTLILLEFSPLIEQWEKALNTFLKVDEELPEYHTKTGRTKKRKSVIGIIHGEKDTSTGIIDIAMAGSLYKKGEFHPRLKEYGLVLVDECHHSASDTISAVLSHVTAKYVYGVTATPFRGDGLEKINYMLLDR